LNFSKTGFGIVVPGRNPSCRSSAWATGLCVSERAPSKLSSMSANA
jgi:hypothetical protein